MKTTNPFTDAKVVGHDIDPEDYHRRDPSIPRGHPQFVMSRSELVEFNRCPHRWIAGFESDESKATEWGSLVDCLVLTPDQFDTRFAVCPETYPDSKTGEAKPWTFAANFCKEWRKEHEGKQIVKADTHQQAENAVKFAFGQPDIAALIKCSRKQVMVVGDYQDEATGLVVSVKALLDLVPDKDDERFGKVLSDLKTTTCGAEGAWTKKVWDMGYHVQSAFFTDLYCAASGEDRTDFWHVVQESMPPWETVLWPLSADFVEIGRVQYQAALARYCECLKANAWPGYSTGGKWINPLPWMINQM